MQSCPQHLRGPLPLTTPALARVEFQHGNDNILMRIALVIMRHLESDLLQQEDFEHIVTQLKVPPARWGPAKLRQVRSDEEEGRGRGELAPARLRQAFGQCVHGGEQSCQGICALISEEWLRARDGGVELGGMGIALLTEPSLLGDPVVSEPCPPANTLFEMRMCHVCRYWRTPWRSL